LLIIPDVGGDTPPAFDIHWGRQDLYYFENQVTKDDVPINPGETRSFKVAPDQADAWEHFRRTEKWSQPKRITLRFNRLNFGDGTGFVTADGIPFPEGKKTSLTKDVLQINTLKTSYRLPTIFPDDQNGASSSKDSTPAFMRPAFLAFEAPKDSETRPQRNATAHIVTANTSPSSIHLAAGSVSRKG